MSTMKPSVRQEQKSLSQRVGGLEQNFTRFLVGVQQRLSGGDQRLAQLEEQIAALIELNGKDEVVRIIDEGRIARARAEAEVEKGKLDEGIADGYISAAEQIGERSLVVGRVLGPDGKVQEPGRLQLVMPGVQKPFQEKLLNQPVGTTIDLPGGAKFEVQEIYA